MAFSYKCVQQVFTALPLNYLHMHSYAHISSRQSATMQGLYRAQLGCTCRNVAWKGMPADMYIKIQNTMENHKKDFKIKPVPPHFSHKVKLARNNVTQDVSPFSILNHNLPGLNALSQNSSQNNECDWLLWQLGGSPTFQSPEHSKKYILFSSGIEDHAILTKDLSATSTDKEPADNPNEKRKLLCEKLRCEIPMFFNKTTPWHDFSVYTSHVHLRVELKNNCFERRGIRQYKTYASIFRKLCSWYLSQASLELLSIKEIEENSTIEARWRIVGWSPLNMLSTLVMKMPTNCRCFDYISTFHVNEDGQIWKHVVSKVERLSDPILKESPLIMLKKKGMAASLMRKLRKTNANETMFDQTNAPFSV